MNHQKTKRLQQLRRRRHVRRSIVGTSERPRLTVFRSSKHIYAQLIDDMAGRTLAAVATTSAEVRGSLKHGSNVAAAKVAVRSARNAHTRPTDVPAVPSTISATTAMPAATGPLFRRTNFRSR